MRPARGQVAEPAPDHQPSKSSVTLTARLVVDGLERRPGWVAGVDFSMDERPALTAAALDEAFLMLRRKVDEELGLK